VFTARLICTDADCTCELEAIAPRLIELETLSCDACGCALAIVGFADWAEPDPLPPAPAAALRAELPLAA